ncbi:MAG: prenyltransferase [Euryarchaeota archaeon]|nr:prenyltransferase [Euryarchaeota archaeon]
MIKTLIKSTRLTWASKTINMYLLVLTYAYFSPQVINNPYDILEGLILVSVLWGALYSLNDLTDLESDKKDRIKRERAFIQGDVEKKWIFLFVGILVSSVLIISLITLKLVFSLILALMLINQVIYTVPPIRLKDTILAPFTSTGTNTVLRIASCCVLLNNLFLVPLSVYILMYIGGMGTYLMYKSKTSVTHILSVIFGILLIYILLIGDINLIQFALAILPGFLATVPLYFSNFTDKEKMLNIADILYHRVAMVFFLVGIFVILFVI